MEQLFQRSLEKIARTGTQTIRDFTNKIQWDNRLIGIRGARGVGKTTLLLQYLKKHHYKDPSALYVSLDHFYFAETRLYDLADEFYKKGGKLLVMDEVQRYPDWTQEVKNMYDDFPDLKMVFTASSLLHIQKAKADLSRRAVVYDMPGLSFREFLNFELHESFSAITLEDVFTKNPAISASIIEKIHPLEFFSPYLNYGYYPFYLENKGSYHQKLSESLQMVVEVDIPQFIQMPVSHIYYLKKLLRIIATSAPFKPNMSSLSERTGISANTLKSYLFYLDQAQLISLLTSEPKGINSLGKPDKIFLNNTNVMYNLAGNETNIGNARETFVYNQMSQVATINSAKSGDFLINDQFTVEVGGKNKGKKQIQGISDSYIVKDGIEAGYGNIIPIWLFGFLY